jgi:hypothetical protein
MTLVGRRRISVVAPPAKAYSVPKRSSRARCPRKHPVGRQQFLKAAAGAAGARVVPPQLLEKLFVAVHSLRSPLDAGFGRVALPALTAGLESRGGRRSDLGVSWRTSLGREALAGLGWRRRFYQTTTRFAIRGCTLALPRGQRNGWHLPGWRSRH